MRVTVKKVDTYEPRYAGERDLEVTIRTDPVSSATDIIGTAQVIRACVALDQACNAFAAGLEYLNRVLLKVLDEAQRGR